MQPTLSDVSCKYGAPMGRVGSRQDDKELPRKFYLRRVYLNSGGYDSGGAYWGHGEPLYWAVSEDGEAELFLRAKFRKLAKEKVRASYPNAVFFV